MGVWAPQKNVLRPQNGCVRLQQTSTSVFTCILKKIKQVCVKEKNDIGLILLDLLMIWESDWLKETWGVRGASREQQMG